MRNLKKIRIAVFCGGISKERSFVSGKEILKSLKRQGYNAFLIDPKHDDICQKLTNADVVFLAIYGRYGEDGKIQGFLETLKIPYTGSGVLASALGMNKTVFKNILMFYKIPVLKYEIFNDKNNFIKEARRIINVLGLPLFLKPVSEGGSLGSAVIHTKKELVETVKKNLKKGFDKYMAEEYIAGKSVTIGLFENKRGIKCFPVLETVSKEEFYDFKSKYNPEFRTYHCPANLPERTYKLVQKLAKRCHRLIGCHGYSRVDFMIDKEDKPFVLEINTLPGLSPRGNMVTMAKKAGISYNKLIIKILKTAFTKPSYLP